MGIQLQNDKVLLLGHYFKIPIHPLLMDETKQYDSQIAVDAFARAVKLWKKEFPALVEKLPPKEQDHYHDAFDDNPRVRKTRLGYVVNEFGWQSRLGRETNGFASGLCLDMNCSCIGIQKGSGDHMHEFFLQSESLYDMSLEDALKFSTGDNEYRVPPNDELKAVMVPCYSGHNIDNHGTSLMLRLWGIEYLNTMMDKLKL